MKSTTDNTPSFLPLSLPLFLKSINSLISAFAAREERVSEIIKTDVAGLEEQVLIYKDVLEQLAAAGGGGSSSSSGGGGGTVRIEVVVKQLRLRDLKV